MFSQIYLSLPRPAMGAINPIVAYTAIGSLTTEYLKITNFVKNVSPYKEYSYGEEIPREEYKKLKANEWAIISYNVSTENLLCIVW